MAAPVPAKVEDMVARMVVEPSRLPPSPERVQERSTPPVGVQRMDIRVTLSLDWFCQSLAICAVLLVVASLLVLVMLSK